MGVLIGAHNVSKAEVGQEEFEVAETIFATGENKPYRYIHDENRYDIVILRLNGYSQHSPIDINDFAPPVYDGTSESEDLELVLAGWGSSRRGDPSSETLKEVSLDSIPVVPCKQIYSKRKETWYGGGRRDLVCAARTVNGETSGPCSGDNGAPLINMKNGKLVGIVTTRFVSTSCDDEDYPGVFTSVYFYRDWIDSHIKKFSCPWFETLKYPTSAPSLSLKPTTFTMTPSESPTFSPSILPSVVQSIEPTEVPTTKFSENPTKTHSPSISPTKMITKAPTK